MTKVEQYFKAVRLYQELERERMESIRDKIEIPTLAEMNRMYMREVVAICDGNRKEAAKRLDISAERLRRHLGKAEVTA